MMKLLLNVHVIDFQNIGDLCSTPLDYFPFRGYEQQRVDIRELDTWLATDGDRLQDYEQVRIIVGGGGLLFKRFLPAFQQLQTLAPKAQLISWGIGQQLYKTQGDRASFYQQFDYQPYLQGFRFSSIRDVDHPNPQYPWVPCASCLHPAFDQPRPLRHQVVVFSHKKFQLHWRNLPRLTHETQDFNTILDFLASGETILTSSYHGAYWGTLLGRKVLAFPFSSKFHTLKHRPSLYPVDRWRTRQVLGRSWPPRWPWQRPSPQPALTCSIYRWQEWVADIPTYPHALQECRDRNHWYYRQVMES